MTGWHVDDEALQPYVERTDWAAEGASVEQHLLTCARCRARVNTASTAVNFAVVDLAAVWDRTRDAVEVPRPSVFERLLRAAGLPAHEARLVAVASAFRGVWLVGVAAVLAFAALAAVIGHDSGLWFFLAVAPLTPIAVLALALPAVLLFGLVVPGEAPVAWLLPAVGFVAVVLAASTWVSPLNAAMAVSAAWLMTVWLLATRLASPAPCSRPGPRWPSWRWPRHRSEFFWYAGVGCASFDPGGSGDDHFDQFAWRRAHVRCHPGPG